MAFTSVTRVSNDKLDRGIIESSEELLRQKMKEKKDRIKAIMAATVDVESENERLAELMREKQERRKERAKERKEQQQQVTIYPESASATTTVTNINTASSNDLQQEQYPSTNGKNLIQS